MLLLNELLYFTLFITVIFFTVYKDLVDIFI